MAPTKITTREGLAFFHEKVDVETGILQHTTFAVADQDGIAYLGKSDLPKRDITFQQLASVLEPIPDDNLFPKWEPENTELTHALEDTLPHNICIKRPDLALYDIFHQHNALNILPKGFLEEANIMEVISKHPHPNIIRYHGYRVRRAYITGLVLERHPRTLIDFLKNKVGFVDKESFMGALESAIHLLHSLGLAHNDLHPANILVDEKGAPVLIDFGSTRETGAKLGTSRGTKGWINGEMKDYHTSDKNHDLLALEKIRMPERTAVCARYSSFV